MCIRDRSWVQYFMPYSEVGYVKNATKDALLNLEIKEGKARLVPVSYTHLDVYKRQGQIKGAAHRAKSQGQEISVP